MVEVNTKSVAETQKIAHLLVRELQPRTRAVAVALSGDLGSGKTTFAQGFARALGIRENITSPTFVLLKIYPVAKKFKYFIHIDCYRLKSEKDLLPLGFKKLLQDKNAIILIEWAERVRKLLPRDVLWIRFLHKNNPHERILTIKS